MKASTPSALAAQLPAPGIQFRQFHLSVCVLPMVVHGRDGLRRIVVSANPCKKDPVKQARRAAAENLSWKRVSLQNRADGIDRGGVPTRFGVMKIPLSRYRSRERNRTRLMVPVDLPR